MPPSRAGAPNSAPAGTPPSLGTILDAGVDPKYTLSAHPWKYLQGCKEGYRAAGNGFGHSMFSQGEETRALPARHRKDGSGILVRQGDSGPGYPATMSMPLSPKRST